VNKKKTKKDQTFDLYHNLEQNMLKPKLQMPFVVKGLFIGMACKFVM